MGIRSYVGVIVVAVILNAVSSQTISCYDCDPMNFAADCGDPVGNIVRSSPCTVDPNIVNGTAVCLSAFINVTGSSTTNFTGIYRSCHTFGPAVVDFCDWFREEKRDFNTRVITCEACNTTRCNILGFREDEGNGANNMLASSVFILIVNAVLVSLLNGRE